eukprot:scaffold4737_cov371-Prasinococcus_capsulatus_cf.AAC.3
MADSDVEEAAETSHGRKLSIVSVIQDEFPDLFNPSPPPSPPPPPDPCLSFQQKKPKKDCDYHTTQIALVIDYQFVKKKIDENNGLKNVDDVVDFVLTVIQNVNLQYEQETLTKFMVTYVIVYASAGPDPYKALFDASGGDLLGAVKDHWQANHECIARDTVQLFTGYEVSKFPVGVAYVGGMCKNAHYSLVKAWTKVLATASDTSAHELGHMWGLTHCPNGGCPHFTMHESIQSENRFVPPNVLLMGQLRDALVEKCVVLPKSKCYVPPPAPPSYDLADYPVPQEAVKMCPETEGFRWNEDGCGNSYCDAFEGEIVPLKVSWFEAYDICKSEGVRMCHNGESSAVSSGCSYNSEYMWTQTPCSVGGVTGKNVSKVATVGWASVPPAHTACGGLRDGTDLACAPQAIG